MARLGMGVVLAVLALACATTAPVEKNAREFRYQVSNDVKQIEAGHWTGSWANRGVCLDNVGRKDEEALRKIVQRVYDIEADDRRLRVLPDGSEPTDEAAHARHSRGVMEGFRLYSPAFSRRS